MISAQDIMDIASASGFDANIEDALMLTDMTAIPMSGEAVPHQSAERSASSLRRGPCLGVQTIPMQCGRMFRP